MRDLPGAGRLPNGIVPDEWATGARRRPRDLLDDPAQTRWAQGRLQHAVSAHRVGDAPIGVGSKVQVTRRVGRRVFPMTMEITEFDPPRSWRLHGVDGPVRGDVHGTIEPLDEGRRSRLTLDLDFEAHGMGKVLVPLVVRPFARKEMPKNEQRLKNLLEHSAGA